MVPTPPNGTVHETNRTVCEVAGPSGEKFGPSREMAGPSGEKSGTSGEVAGPSRDMAGLSGEEFGTSDQVAGPSDEEFGTNDQVAGPEVLEKRAGFQKSDVIEPKRGTKQTGEIHEMAKQDFIPGGDGDFLTWHDKLKNRLPVVGPTVGSTAAEAQTVSDDNAQVHTAYDDLGLKERAYRAAVKVWNGVKQNATGNARGIIRRAKAHGAYTDAIGHDLGAIGPEESTDLTQSQPTLRLEDTPQGIVVRFNKSIADGVNIYCKRVGEAKATFLGLDTHSPYLDSRDNLADAPEEREYHGVYVKNDQEIGQPSATVKVTVAA